MQGALRALEPTRAPATAATTSAGGAGNSHTTGGGDADHAGGGSHTNAGRGLASPPRVNPFNGLPYPLFNIILYYNDYDYDYDYDYNYDSRVNDYYCYVLPRHHDHDHHHHHTTTVLLPPPLLLLHGSTLTVVSGAGAHPRVNPSPPRVLGAGSLSHERLLEEYAWLLRHHASTSPFPPGRVRSLLERALTWFPANRALLRALSAASASTHARFHLRRFLRSTLSLLY